MYINVANLVSIKNHNFLIEVFGNIKKNNPDSVLWIVGQGPLLDTLTTKVRESGLENSVVFWGKRDDVNELLQAADAFILTSFTEGFSFAALEAQTAGLMSFLSDGLPNNVKVTNLVYFMDVNDKPEKWAKMIADIVSQVNYNRLAGAEFVSEAGFDVRDNAIMIEKFYLEGSNIHEN